MTIIPTNPMINNMFKSVFSWRSSSFIIVGDTGEGEGTTRSEGNNVLGTTVGNDVWENEGSDVGTTVRTEVGGAV